MDALGYAPAEISAHVFGGFSPVFWRKRFRAWHLNELVIMMRRATTERESNPLTMLWRPPFWRSPCGGLPSYFPPAPSRLFCPTPQQPGLCPALLAWGRGPVSAPCRLSTWRTGWGHGGAWGAFLSRLIPLSGLSNSKAQKHFSTRFYGLPLAGKILK